MDSGEILRYFKNDLVKILDCEIKQSLSRQVFELTGSFNCLLYVKTRKHKRTNWGITASVINRLKDQSKTWLVVLLSSNQNNGYVLNEKDIDYYISKFWDLRKDGDYKTSTTLNKEKWFNSLGEFVIFMEKNISQENSVEEIIRNSISFYEKKYKKESVESTQHLQLKKLISENPELIGLRDIVNVNVEYSYPSGDRVDVAFELKDDNWVVVEIELNGLSETMIGLFQAVKYRALQTSLIKLEKKNGSTLGYLVALNIPNRVKEFAKILDIKTYEIELE